MKGDRAFEAAWEERNNTLSQLEQEAQARDADIVNNKVAGDLQKLIEANKQKWESVEDIQKFLKEYEAIMSHAETK